MSKKLDTKLESEFQASLISRAYETWGRNTAIVLKNDTGYMQGIMDLTFILPRALIVFLEVKPYEGAPYEPNQEYYLDLVQRLGFFSATIYPENEEVVFRAIRDAYRARG